MELFPPLAVLIITYNRLEILRETIKRTYEHLAYRGERKMFIADDGSDDGTQAMVATEFPDAVLVQTNRGGLGANTNAGMLAAWRFSPLVLRYQDDMWMEMTVDVEKHVETLAADETCGMIRIWGCGGHKFHASLENSGYWRIWWSSPELYIPSDRPSVSHKRFHDYFGMFPIGLKTGETENAWSHQCKDASRLNGKQLDVFVPHSLEVEKNFVHAGWHSRWRDKGL